MKKIFRFFIYLITSRLTLQYVTSATDQTLTGNRQVLSGPKSWYYKNYPRLNNDDTSNLIQNENIKKIKYNPTIDQSLNLLYMLLSNRRMNKNSENEPNLKINKDQFYVHDSEKKPMLLSNIEEKNTQDTNFYPLYNDIMLEENERPFFKSKGSFNTFDYDFSEKDEKNSNTNSFDDDFENFEKLYPYLKLLRKKLI